MDPPPLIQRALLRLVLQVRFGVGGAPELEPSPPRGTQLLWLLARLPVRYVSRLLPPGAAASPPTTISSNNAPSLVDLIVLFAVYRLRRLPPLPLARIDHEQPVRAASTVPAPRIDDEQPVRAASTVPAPRRALARSLLNCVVYLVLRRVRRLPPPRATLDSDSHHLGMTPAMGNRTTTLTTLLPRLLTSVALFIRRFTPPSAEARVDATAAVMGLLLLRRPSHSLFRLLVIRALHRARHPAQAARSTPPRQAILSLTFLSLLWRARQMVPALFQSRGGRGAVGALGFLILVNTRTTRRLMAISHVLLRGQITQLQVIAVWSAFHMSLLILGYFFSSHGTERGLVGRNRLQGDDGIAELPAGNSNSNSADRMNCVLPVNEPRRPSVLPLLAFLRFQRRAQRMYAHAADSVKSPEKLQCLMDDDTVSDARVSYSVCAEELYLENGSSEEHLLDKGHASDGASDNGRIVISTFEEACQVINRWRDGKLEAAVEIASGTPSSTVKDISSKFIKQGADSLLGERPLPL